MFTLKLLISTVLLVGVSARPSQWVVDHDELRQPEYDFGDGQDRIIYEEEYQQPGHLIGSRVRRQSQATLSLNHDGSAGLQAKVPVAHNDKHILSAVGSMGFDNKMNLGSKGVGLAYENVNGHGLSVMKETLPGLGSKLTGAGQTTLFKNDNHQIGANAFVTRNMPSYPGGSDFNSYGGGVDYMFKNKVGGSLGMARTPAFHQNDYSAMGRLNIFRNPTTSIDFGAGFNRMDSPMMHTGWQPKFGFTLNKWF